VLPSEQRQVADREPPSEQRSEGQPGYLGESLLHLHHHRAPISGTQSTDIPPTDIRAMHSRATDIRASWDTRYTPVLRGMDTRAARPFSLFRFQLRISRVWLSHRSRFGGLVAWGRVRYRAFWLSFNLKIHLNP
jgi:hypothetical protein